MLLKLALFVVMAIGLAGFGAVAWISVQAPSTTVARTAVVPRTSVLTAAHLVRAGSLLRPEDIAAVEVPTANVPPGSRVDTPSARSELFGAMVRHTLLAEQQIMPADVMRPGDHGFLAAVLEPGMRAVTVAVDAVSGTAGLIWPGDHVDMILTQSLDEPGIGSSHRISAETVLSDVRVIAIDQQILQGATGGQVQPARTVTLEVPPADAEKVSVAERLGHLSLTIRSLDPGVDVAHGSASKVLGASSATKLMVQPSAAVASTASPNGTSTLGHSHGITYGADVSSALVNERRDAEAKPSMRVFEGSSDGKDFQF